MSHGLADKLEVEKLDFCESFGASTRRKDHPANL